MDLQVEYTIGKLLQIIELKINLKLGYLLSIILILILLFVTILLDGHFMVNFHNNLGLGQLRHHSNASGPQYGKRFKK